MSNDDERASLATMLGGDVIRRFDLEMAVVAQDILDPDKDPKAARSVTLKLIFKPDEKRGMTPALVEVKSKLADPKPTAVALWVGQRLGEPMFVEAYDPRTPDLFTSREAQREHELEEDDE